MESDTEKPNKKSDELEKDSPPKLKQNEQAQEPGVNEAEILEKSNVEDESKKDNTATITIRESDVESVDEPPSMLQSPLTRMKYDWEHSENGAKFCGRVFCSSIASLSRSAFNNKFPILSAAELIVGSIYFHDCPAEPRIPLYLVVVGVLGVFLPLIPICYKYLPKSLQDGIQTRIHIIHRIEAILRIFSFIWFILGCIWVYNAYRPNYINTRAGNYCVRGMYLFVFWLFNIVFIFIFLILTVMCVMVYCVAKGSKNSKNVEKQETFI